MTRWFTEKAVYLATWLGLEVGRLAAKIFPREWLYCLSDTLARLAFHLFSGFRTRSISNLSLALGEKLGRDGVEAMVRSSLRNFFRDFVEIGIALVLPAEKLRGEIPIVGREHLDSALAKGNGVIVLSAHLGNFFLVGTRLAVDGYPTHVLVNQPRNGQFARLMDDYRGQVRQKTIHARPRREALRELGQVLKRNELAMVIADEYRQGNGIHVPFFGRTVVARRGPATLALRTGAAVVPMYLVRSSNGDLRLFIEPELELVRSERGKAEIRENTLRMTLWLERTVRSYPDQWNWMNIHWWGDSEGTLVAKEQRSPGLTY